MIPPAARAYRIAVVGGGSAGMLAALLLQQSGHQTTVFSAQRPEEIRSGWITSTQVIFGGRLRTERDAHLALWDDRAPAIGHGSLSLWAGAERVAGWTQPLAETAQSVDQRIKTARWLELLQERGGDVRYREISGVAELDEVAARHDLVLVASGRAGLSGVFPRDEARSPYQHPQRHLAAVYVAVPYGQHDEAPTIRWHMVDGEGELLVIPALTLTGRCHAVLVEALPGRAWDVFQDRPPAREQWQRIRDLLAEHVPQEADALAAAELTDDRAALAGAIIPTVRRPVAVLPSGRAVLALGDAAVVNDPISAAGGNIAATAAAMYVSAINTHTADAFDQGWMQATFEDLWSAPGGLRDATTIANAMLHPPPHIPALVHAAVHDLEVRRGISHVMETAQNPGWLLDPDAAAAVLSSES